MESEILKWEQIEKGKVYRDVLSGLPVYVWLLDKPNPEKKIRGWLKGRRYNPVKGNDENFETFFERLVPL